MFGVEMHKEYGDGSKFGVEIHKEYGDGSKKVERKEFRNKKDMYQYAILNNLAINLENAREELDDNAFTSLCLHICGFMAEYFT